MSRQNYYARRRQRQRRQVEGEWVAELVKRERRWQPRGNMLPPSRTPGRETPATG